MREYIEKYRDKTRYDLSCSETIIRAANEYYDLGLGENEYKMMAPFSGGLMEGDLCGILTAACSVLGILYTDQVAHNSPVLKEAVLLYKKNFNDNFNSLDCNWLKEFHQDEISGCNDLIIQGGLLLHKVVKSINETYQK